MYPMIEHQLKDKQKGFREARSVVLQLVVFLDESFNPMENKESEQVLALYIDFRKALGKVTLQKLISKLGDMGISEKLLKLISIYLKGQKERVKIGQKKSKMSKITSGAPQGSILGPLRFIVYINNLPKCVQRTPAFG